MQSNSQKPSKSVKKSDSQNSGRRETQNSPPTDIESNLLKQVESFKRLGDPDGGETQELQARVNVVEATGTFDKLKDRKNNFQSVVSLLKDENGFEFCLSRATEVAKCRIAQMKEVHDIAINETSFLIELDDGGNVFMQFMNVIDMEKFHKKLTILVHVNNVEFTDLEIGSRKGTNDWVQYPVSTDNSHQPGTPVKKTISSRCSGTVFDCLASKSGKIYEFYHQQCRSWGVEQVRKWLKYVFIQEEPEGKIMTFFQLLNQTMAGNKKKKTLLKSLCEYIRKGKNIFHIEKQMNEFEQINNNNEEIDPLILPLVTNDFVRLTWCRELEMIKMNKGLFNMPFARIIEKRVRKYNHSILLAAAVGADDVRRRRRNRNITLSRIRESNLCGPMRKQWDPEEMRDFLLCQLLFQKSMENVIQFYERMFEDFILQKESKETEEKEEKEETEGEEEEEEEEEDTSPTPEKYLQFVSDFGVFEIEKMSFRVHLQCKKSRAQIQMKKHERKMSSLKKPFEETKSKLDLATSNLELQTAQLAPLMRVFQCEKTKVEVMLRLNDQITVLNKKIAELRMQESVHRKEVEFVGLQIEKLGPRIEALRKEIEEGCEIDLVSKTDECYMQYLKTRRISWSRFLKTVLIHIAKEKGYLEISNKMVISALTSNRPVPVPDEDEGLGKNAKKKKRGKQATEERIQEIVIGVLDYINEGILEWGLLHTSVLVGSLQIHWFKDAIVHFNQLSMSGVYDEICCIDCNCPLILNRNNIYQNIENLAFEIVSANVNMEYDELSFFFSDIEQRKKMNCQEFSKKLLTSLQYTPFYEDTLKFNRAVVRKICDDGKRAADELRFIIITPEFEEKFKKVFQGHDERFKLEKEKKYGSLLYFWRHSELDDFFCLCLAEDSYFRINHRI